MFIVAVNAISSKKPIFYLHSHSNQNLYTSDIILTLVHYFSYSKLSGQNNSRSKSGIGMNGYGKNTSRIISFKIKASDGNDDDYDKTNGKLWTETRKGSTSIMNNKIKIGEKISSEIKRGILVGSTSGGDGERESYGDGEKCWIHKLCAVIFLRPCKIVNPKKLSFVGMLVR